MNEQRMQFAIGIVTLIAGFALAAMIIWFGELQFALQPRKTYYVTFKEAPGAEPKLPVRRAGIRIGEVTEVVYDEEYALVVLTLVIEGNNELRDGDVPTLQVGMFLNETYLDIVTAPSMQGVPDRAIIPPGSTLEGRTPVSVMARFEEASELFPQGDRTLKSIETTSTQWNEVGERTNRILANNEQQINEIVKQTQESMVRLAETLDSINSILTPESQENLRVTLKNLREASAELKPVITASKQTIEQITTTTAKLDEVATNLQTTTKPLAERSESTMRNLDEASVSMNEAMADLKIMVRQFRTQDGSLQRMMNDPALYQNLDNASYMLMQTLGQLDPILADLKVFSDKIARHPGELGVQGVITRDGGLKNVEPGTIAPRRHGFLRKPVGDE